MLEAQGITRLDVLNFISHGISKVPLITGDSESKTDTAESGVGEEGPATARDPLAAYTVNLSERARAGKLDPLIGRTAELQRTLEILCRRRKNNPVFVGDAGVGKTALAEGLAKRLLDDDVPHGSGVRRFLRLIPQPYWPALGSAGTSKNGSRP